VTTPRKFAFTNYSFLATGGKAQVVTISPSTAEFNRSSGSRQLAVSDAGGIWIFRVEIPERSLLAAMPVKSAAALRAQKKELSN
jgi:hypothetical protein